MCSKNLPVLGTVIQDMAVITSGQVEGVILHLLDKAVAHLEVITLQPCWHRRAWLSSMDTRIGNICQCRLGSQLENFTIIDPISTMTLLIARIKFPTSTILDLQCYLDGCGTMSGLLPFIVDNFSGQPSSPQSATSAQMILQYLFPSQ